MPSPPFDGIFESRPLSSVRVEVVPFYGLDLNECARATLRRFDDAVDANPLAGAIFLTTIELEVNGGRFPDMLAAYFNSELWDYATRYYIESVVKDESGHSYRTGRITFEACCGLVNESLRFGDGYRWGGSLSVGGVRVPEKEVAACLRRSPFVREDAEFLTAHTDFACACSDDLDELRIWDANRRQP